MEFLPGTDYKLYVVNQSVNEENAYMYLEFFLN